MKSTLSVAQAFEALLLREGAPLEEAEAAYRFLTTKFHPDQFQQHPGMRSQAGEQQRRLNEAIRVIRLHRTTTRSTGKDRPNPSDPPAPPPKPNHQPTDAAQPVHKPKVKLWHQCLVGLAPICLFGLFAVLVASQNGITNDSRRISQKGDPLSDQPTNSQSSATQPEPDACAEYQSYAPASVTLDGKLTSKTFRVSPSSDGGGGSSESFWILNLGRPICTSGGGSGSPTKGEDGVWNLQLTLTNSEMYRAYLPLLDGGVAVTGSLLPATTAHHHTKVIFQVTGMELRRAPSHKRIGAP